MPAPILHVAVCVKTPGLSPIKTRLAAGIGAEVALEFYRRACQAVGSLLIAASEAPSPLLVPYWAVAEARGVDAWRGFPVVAQGEGGLGARLGTVAQALHEAGDPSSRRQDSDLATFPGRPVAVLIGADAPQIGHADFQETTALIAAGFDFVLGPAVDGGFYLCALARPVPLDLWQRVIYSVGDTALALARELRAHGSVGWLTRRLTDVDTVGDLAAAAAELADLTAPTEEQTALRRWLECLTVSA